VRYGVAVVVVEDRGEFLEELLELVVGCRGPGPYEISDDLAVWESAGSSAQAGRFMLVKYVGCEDWLHGVGDAESAHAG
jgi:hypothetical protein